MAIIWDKKPELQGEEAAAAEIVKTFMDDLHCEIEEEEALEKETESAKPFFSRGFGLGK